MVAPARTTITNYRPDPPADSLRENQRAQNVFMSTPNTAAKPRSKLFLIVIGAVLGVMAVDLVIHWSDFKEGFRNGYAAGAKGK